MTQQETSAPTPAEKYEQFFVPAIFGARARILVDHASPKPGESVLDLAYGTACWQ